MADSKSEQNSSGQAKIWTEKNIFAKSITFSPDQIFPIEGLSYNNYSAGSILYTTGSSWDILKPTKNNQVLTFNARGLSWQTPSLSIVEGVLPVSKGGTGWTLFPDNGILINTGKEMLDLMPIPKEKKILMGENKNLNWYDYNTFADDISKLFKTILVKDNEAVFDNFNPIFKLKDQSFNAGMSLLSNDKKFVISTNSFDFNNKNNNSKLTFDFDKNKINFEINNNVVFELDESARLSNVTLLMDQIQGNLPVAQGGLGNLKYERGDIIFASSSKELSILSTNKSEGYYLQVKDGIPTYVPLDKSGFDGVFDMPLVLSGTKNGFAPLKFIRSALTEKCVEGSIEFDGSYLYLTNAQGRKALSFLTSNITGTASNVTGVVSLENGGTGQNLNDLAIGQILIKNHEVIGSFEQGLYGQVLMSQGACNMPAWRDAILDVFADPDSGIILNLKEGVINAQLDQSINFNPTWQGKHTFIKPLTLKSKLKLSDSKTAPLNFETNKNIENLTTGDVWFDGDNLQFYNGNQTISLTAPTAAINQAAEFIQSHYLTLAAGADVSENRKIRMKTPVPHLTTKGSLAHGNWKLRRLEIILDELPTQGNAIFRLKCGNKILIDQGVIFNGKDAEVFENFNELVVTTGEILQLECLNASNSNFWSAFLLIDLL